MQSSLNLNVQSKIDLEKENKRLEKNRKQRERYYKNKIAKQHLLSDPSLSTRALKDITNTDNHKRIEKNKKNRERYQNNKLNIENLLNDSDMASQIRTQIDLKKQIRNQRERDIYSAKKRNYNEISEETESYYQAHKRKNDRRRELYQLKTNSKENYFENINKLPDQTCEICARMLYPDGVVQLNITDPIKRILLDADPDLDLSDTNKVTACHTCNASLKNSKLPPMAICNKLNPGEIPHELDVLTDIELSLISNLMLCAILKI